MDMETAMHLPNLELDENMLSGSGIESERKDTSLLMLNQSTRTAAKRKRKRSG
jgi:hypothetical protein